MEINKKRIKKDFEDKTIIDYITDYFNNHEEGKDDEFYADTLMVYSKLINSKEISDEQKYFIKNKMSFFTYFMNGKSNLLVNPYILFDNEDTQKNLSGINAEDLDKHFKDKYEEYLHKLQEAHLNNGKLNGKRCKIISSMIAILNKNYEFIKNEKARIKYEKNIRRFQDTREKYNKKDIVDNKLIDMSKLKLKLKNLKNNIDWKKIGDLNIAVLGVIEYTEQGTGVDRSLNIYATKALKDTNYDVIFGNLDLASLDTQNFEGKYSKERKMAETVRSVLLSQETIKSSVRFNNGYIGEAEKNENGKMGIVYDPYDATIASLVRERLIEKINDYEDKSNDLDKGAKGEEQSER